MELMCRSEWNYTWEMYSRVRTGFNMRKNLCFRIGIPHINYIAYNIDYIIIIILRYTRSWNGKVLSKLAWIFQT